MYNLDLGCGFYCSEISKLHEAQSYLVIPG